MRFKKEILFLERSILGYRKISMRFLKIRIVQIKEIGLEIEKMALDIPKIK